MTISSPTNRVAYAGPGNGFAYGFPVFDADDVFVQIVTDAGVLIEPVKDGVGTYDFAVSGTFDGDQFRFPAGVTVTLNNSLPSGYTIAIENRPAPTQESDYVNGGPLNAERLETDIDILTVRAQAVDTKTARALRVPQTDPTPGLVPAAALRAGKLLEFDGSGNPKVTTLTADLLADQVPQAEAARDAAAASASAASSSATAAATSADEAAASAAVVPIPAGGDLNKLMVVNATEDGYDLTTGVLTGTGTNDIPTRGQVDTAIAAARVLLQAAYAEDLSARSTTSDTAVDSGSAITVTGATSGSRMRVRATVNSGSSSGGALDIAFQIRRGTTDITPGATVWLSEARPPGGGSVMTHSMVVQDTGHGGGSVTYRLYWARGGSGTAYLGRSGTVNPRGPAVIWEVEEYA